MAKATWCTVNPASGTGKGTSNISGQTHTGRTQRITDVTYKTASGPSKVVKVTQQAKAEFVTLNNIAEGKEGGNLTITGKTNSKKVTFSLGAGDIVLTLPTSYNAGGATVANGADIPNDPGATAEFDISLVVVVPENTTIKEKTRVITAVVDGGQTASATIKQAAGDPYITVVPDEVTITAAGTAVSVEVDSNDEWTVE